MRAQFAATILLASNVAVSNTNAAALRKSSSIVPRVEASEENNWFTRTLESILDWLRDNNPQAEQLTLCNGYAALCSRSYGNITHIGSHNSYAVSTNPLSLSANQRIPVLDQLDRGVRLLQAQVHLQGTELRLCHTDCFLLDGGSLVDYLKQVKGWLDSHPREGK
ncbi:hypothetical protein FRC03_007491 [Tulasnella sp. 419]|nr:hypothetical protein FRC03_007491 [Tulasnella sp. 419]